MLLLRRKEGQWVEVECDNKILRIRFINIKDGKLEVAFDDNERNFSIKRPEAQGLISSQTLKPVNNGNSFRVIFEKQN